MEEYEGQKIDDIQKYGANIFTVGSDWEGYFDYLKEYCSVIYLQRTAGVSSTEIRSETSHLNLGIVGGYEENVQNKYARESQSVNGLFVSAYCNPILNPDFSRKDYDAFLEQCDCVYIFSHPGRHYEEIKYALEQGKHVLCESPIALKKEEAEELFTLAHHKKLVLMEANKTAYNTAYNRLILLATWSLWTPVVPACSTLQKRILRIPGTAFVRGDRPPCFLCSNSFMSLMRNK